jgi:hypothetical protein
MTSYFRISLLTIFLLLFCLVSFSQSANKGIVAGKITDIKTNKSIEFANVYVANTMSGCITDKDGFFIIKNLPTGKHTVVFSCVGYLPHTLLVNIVADTTHLNIQLAVAEVSLNEVVVSSKVDKRWKKQLEKFKKYFFGNSPNTEYCTILNSYVLDFVEERKDNKKSLKAKASDLLQVENRALGYKITFLLQEFEAGNSIFLYLAQPKYEFLSPKDKKEEIKWEKARFETYKGSLRHFLHTVATGTTQKAGFTVSKNENMYGEVQKVQNYAELCPQSEMVDKKLILFDNYLKVVYNKESTYDINTDKYINNLQTSWLKMNQTKPAIFYLNGYLENPLSILQYGYWATLGVANELPLDYTPISE